MTFSVQIALACIAGISAGISFFAIGRAILQARRDAAEKRSLEAPRQAITPPADDDQIKRFVKALDEKR